MVVTTKTTCIPINSVNLGQGDKTFLPEKYMYEKLTKFPTMFAQKYFTPIFWWWGQMSLYPIFYTYEVYSGMLCVYLLQGVPGTW